MADTRKRKACLRCRFQKLRVSCPRIIHRRQWRVMPWRLTHDTVTQCVLDPEDPEGECVPCKTFSKTSKKTIHRSPCYRRKITDAVLYRRGGLALTRRWEGTEMRDVGDRVHSVGARTIAFTLGAYWQPIVVRVVRFKPRPGDATARWWTTNENGVVRKKKTELEPYCIADIHEASSDFEGYITNNALDAFLSRPHHEDLGEDCIFARTYMIAVAHYCALAVGVPSPPRVEAQNSFHFDVPQLPDQIKDKVEPHQNAIPKANPEKRLMGHLFTLWFATREHTQTRSISYNSPQDPSC